MLLGFSVLSGSGDRRFFDRAGGVVMCGQLRCLCILVDFNRCCAIVSVF